MLLIGGFTLSAISTAALASAAVGDEQRFLAEAVQAYEAAQNEPQRALRLAAFARAEQLFARAAAAHPRSAELQTNLGNAALQAEHLGAAVLAYRRALAADPAHRKAERNLQHARERLPAWVPRPAPAGAADGLFAWFERTPDATRARAAAWVFAAAGALFGIGLALGAAALRTAALVPALAWLALMGSLLGRAGEPGSAAVVMAGEATARASDSAFAPSAFAEPLPAGTEVAIVEERDGWARIRLHNGRDAWLRASSLARVVPEA